MRNLIRALRGRPVELSPKQQEKMDRQRAKAEAIIARQEAAGREAMAEAARFQASIGGADATGASFGGPADGPSLALDPATGLPEMPSIKDVLKQTAEGFRDAVGETFDDREGIIDPGPGANLNRPPAEVDEPAERERVAAAERVAREAARAPYLAAEVPDVAFTRVATTGSRQLDDVAEQLKATGLSAHPERVFGVYRVPDRYDHGKGAERRAYVEWEIAHRPGELPPSAGDEVQVLGVTRNAHWVARRPGEPSVLDEDVSGTLCARAGLRPEDCFGLPRLMHVRGIQSDSGMIWRTHVEGSLVFTRSSETLTRAHEELMAAAPLTLAARPALPFHLEILDWEAAAAWVAPDRSGIPRVPSPLPHLPNTPEELLVAYLEVVGVRSEDCFGVQVTRTSERLLADLSLAQFRQNFRSPRKLPCADGKERARLRAAEHIVIAYRDRGEYQDGRQRWRTYQDEVLHAKLDHRTGVRPPIEVDESRPPSLLSEVFDMFNPLDPMPTFPQLFHRNEAPSLGPYCGTLET